MKDDLGMGRAGTPVLVLVADLRVRVITDRGEPPDELTLDPSRTADHRARDERCPGTPVNGVPGHPKECPRGDLNPHAR